MKKHGLIFAFLLMVGCDGGLSSGSDTTIFKSVSYKCEDGSFKKSESLDVSLGGETVVDYEKQEVAVSDGQARADLVSVTNVDAKSIESEAEKALEDFEMSCSDG